MITRPDLLDERSPAGIEVMQLTADPALPSCHLYMEAQIFTPDSRRFVLHRSANPHNSDRHDPRHRYEVCDLDDGCALFPITHETGATSPSITPDGTALYYFVDETVTNGGRLTLKRVNLDGSDRQTVMVLDTPIPETAYRPSRIYPLSTISSDGKRLAVSAFLGDGQTEDAPWGLLVFDLERATVQLILSGQTWCNIHPQYCRAQDPDGAYDIMIQENHGNRCDATGKVTTLVSGAGADIHLIRDDGTNFRNLPWGRDGNEQCQGHQCWVGRSHTALTSTTTLSPDEYQLITGVEAPFSGHVGIDTPGGVRNNIGRRFAAPRFCHFATDIAGTSLITDDYHDDEAQAVYFARLPQDVLTEPVNEFIYLLNPHSAVSKGRHIHPFLSPDGSMGLFNSDETGVLQAYLVRGLEHL